MEETAIKGDPPPKYGSDNDEEAVIGAASEEHAELNSKNEDGNRIERSDTKKRSVVYRVRQANLEAKTPVEGTKNVMNIFWDAFGDIINLALHNVLAIAILIVGIIYYDRDQYCKPANLGLLLVLGGALTLVRGFVELMIKWRRDRFNEDNPPDTLHKALRAFSGLLALLALIWTITAWIIVFPLKVDYQPGSSNYCDRTLYLFSFWILVLPFIFIGIILLLFCSVGCCIAFCAGVAAAASD